ncbi:MAG: hypothetical protein JW820_10515, partial [Spirochaetales bacterium]|nr:hypothetical protein [Spirochaetales bacterium]
MRRAVPALRILTVLIVSAVPAAALGPEKPWFGGVYSGFSGFSSQTGLPAAEYLSVGLFAEPLAVPVLNPALGVGVLLPFSPCTEGALRLQFILDLTLADVPVSFLQKRFYLASRWSPGLSAECLVPFDFAT